MELIIEAACDTAGYPERVDFWSTFWATMWGALAGAGFGALAAWLFSLNLRRRQETYEAAVRKSDLDRAHKQELDTAVAKVVQLFGEYSAAAQAFKFAFAPNAKLSVETPHAAGARLLASIRVAQMTAAPEEQAPLEAAFAVATNREQETSNERDLSLSNAADMLALWRRGKLSTDDAATAVRHPRKRTSPPDEPNQR
ncbi:hypothetical protein [Microbacterium imperiale]|uniref:hypothetical protein n=1 Tax=Microbacterium imperiale TaxID=33884 RepID=UPI001AEA777D|nr:hypothetical protein [Microbacterium imperiale]MBP2420726.1 hypothetical protein [Microbacterium imperiale]MDS0200631.1 hypothetical protein [Microbacterium imperiale]BFE41066.1 hypothetical protein GCM10017544_20220 [Microbacterium imperiale]